MGNYAKSGRSRAKGASRARGGSSAAAGKRTGGNGRNHTSGGSGGNSGSGFSRIAAGGVLLIVVIAVIAGILRGMGQTEEKETSSEQQTETETTTETETELLSTVSVAGIDITGLSRADAEKKLDEAMPWSMKVTYGDQVYEVSNLIAEKIHSVLDEVYSGIPDETYELDASGLEEAAAREAAAAAGKWDKKAKNGSIDSYDAASDKFVFSGAQSGVKVDQEKLAADILAAVKNKDYGASVEASAATVDPEYSESAAKEKYRTVSSFTTKTTANEKRNTNIKLAAKAINGTVLQPGETFSFNGTVGQRTEAKGYQGAAAYNNGEVVQEIGGGVCQVSSTLYNAVVKAGLKTTKRQSHTFEPNYVTPGTDATVSWGGPDYCFMNNSGSAIGIRASYASRELTVSIYAVPILEDGVTYSLKSTKIKDYTTGTDAEKNSGLQSKWETRLVVSKNGEVVSQNVDHTVTYKSHTKANDAAEAESIKAAEEAAKLASEAAASAGATIEASSSAGAGESNTAAQTTADSNAPSAASQTQSTNIQAGPGSASAAETTTAAASAPTAAESTTAASAPGNSAAQTGAASGPGSVSPAPTAAAPGSDSQAPGSGSGTVETIAPMPGA